MARIEFETREPVDDVVFGILFFTSDGQVQCELSTEVGEERISLRPGRGAIEFRTEELGLLPDVYFTSVHVQQRDAQDVIHYQYKSTVLRVESDRVLRGNFYLPHEWDLRQIEHGDERNTNYQLLDVSPN